MSLLAYAVGYTLSYAAMLHGLFSIAFRLDEQTMCQRCVLVGAFEALGGLAGCGLLLAITGGFL